ncbi:MAG: efflux RND transporter permease subunit [Gammaproteobacteria bacterium]|nr:efflux RND transporter permease subunit [Gammaproteobacteria bacterium]
MISWFARNSVAANLLMVTIILGGLYAVNSSVRLEVFPPFDIDTVSVSVPLRGATPEDVELGVAVRIEEAVQDLEGIDRIISRSVEGRTTVQIEIQSDYDPRVILDDIKSRVDAINTFPADTEKPIISISQRRFDVINVVVSGEYAEEEIRRFAEQVRDELLRIDVITQADLSSVRRYEIAIEASADRLREFDVTLADIAAAIRASSVDLSAGNVRTEGGDVLIRSKGQAYRRAEFEEIVVKTNSDGSIVRVRDIAVVKDGFEEESVRTTFNGKHAAFIDISRTGKQSALEISQKVKDYIEARRDSLPQGIELGYWDDDAQILKTRLGILAKSAIQGSVLVILLLTLFLRPAIAGWVFLGIPISFLGAFILMSVLDISLNMMSAFGFILVLGIVVDDAIVTGENVYKHMQTGDSGLSAAIHGTKEVAIPVTFGILTTIAAFTPLIFVEGRLGTWFSPIPLVVIPVLLFSLVESKLILPAHLAHVKLRKDKPNARGFAAWQRRFADGFEEKILRHYQPFLDFTLRHRQSTLAAFTGVLLVMIMLVSSGWTRFVFFPSVDSETATATLVMPVGTPFDVTERHATRIFDAAQQLRKKYADEAGGNGMITNILATTGSIGNSNGTNLARVRFETAPRETRTSDLTVSDLVNEWRQLVGPVPGAETINFRATFFRPGEPIDVQFSGNSLEELSRVGNELKEHLATYPGVFEIADSLSDGKEELRIELSPQGHLIGLTRSDIVRQVSEAFKGLEAQRIQRGRDDIRVLVRFPIDERKTLSSLNEMLITAPNGRQIPLANVATFVPGKGPSQITRIDRYRVLNVTADVDKDNTNMVVLQADLREFLDEMLAKYPSISYDMEGEQRQQRESFGSLQAGLIVLMFVIYCLLALPLKSYVQPLIVMSVIPFGIIGAIIGHWIMGHPLSFLSSLGLMALMGVVINDSLVLVDYVNQQNRAGEPLEDSVKRAGVARFRPVMLTSLTTFFGLLPLLTERATSAVFLVPMAISLGFGILFATLITLILVPTNIMLVDDLRRYLSARAASIGDAVGAR